MLRAASSEQVHGNAEKPRICQIIFDNGNGSFPSDTDLFVKGRQNAAEMLWFRRTATIRAHLDNIIVSSCCPNITIANGPNGLAVCIAVDVFRSQIA
jgi:hypothetical protein